LIRKSLFGLGLAALAVTGCSRGSDDVLAVVDGESIPMSTYHKKLEMKNSVVALVDPSRLNVDPASGQIMRQLTEVSIDPSYRLGVQALRDCINEVIARHVAKDEGVYPTKDQIEAEIKFQQSRKPKYVQDLSDAGLSTEDIRDMLGLQMATMNLWSKGVNVSKEEVDQFIKENPDRFREPEQAALLMIEVDDPKKKDLADKELKEGQFFKTVAQHYSVQRDGKSNDFRFPETVVDRFPPALKALIAKTNEFGTTDWQFDKPSNHWVKFYVERKVKSKMINIDDYVREMIRRDLLLNKGMKSNDVNKRLADKLKGSKIEVKVKYLEGPWKKLYDSLTAKNPGSNPAATPDTGAPATK